MTRDEVLRIRGLSECHNYLIREVQKVYRQQGVDTNDKHIEVIVRQMMRKVRVEDAGDSDLLSGSTIDALGLAVRVAKDGNDTAGGSILGLMMLGAAKGDTVDVVVEGDNADAVLGQLCALIDDGFGED